MTTQKRRFSPLGRWCTASVLCALAGMCGAVVIVSSWWEIGTCAARFASGRGKSEGGEGPL